MKVLSKYGNFRQSFPQNIVNLVALIFLIYFSCDTQCVPAEYQEFIIIIIIILG
jgi:uncharacterized membrane protein